MTAVKKAAIICRVSSSQQDFQRQVSDIKKLAHKLGYVIESEDDIYTEKVSGRLKADDRPAIGRLKRDVASGEKTFGMIFAQEVSRIGRNPGDAKNTVEFFAEYGIPLYVQTIHMCSFKANGERNEMFHIVYDMMAEFAKIENDVRAMRSRSGTLEKVRNGHYGTGVMIPYGYGKSPEKRLIIDPEEAEVVREIFNYILKGLGTKQIAHILNEQRVPTRTQKVLKNKGTLKMKYSKIEKDVESIKWVDGTVYSILKNPIYKGERQYLVSYDRDRNNKKVNLEYETIPSPVIIKPLVWEKVQEVMKERFDSRVRDTRWHYILRGLMVCGVCGRNMYGRYKIGGKDSYYQCSSVRHKGCGNCGIGIETLESCVWNVIRDSSRVLEYFKFTGSELGAASDDVSRAKVNLEIKEKNLEELGDELERVNFAYFKKKLSVSRWELETSRIEKNIEEARKDVAVLQQRLKALSKTKARLSNMNSYIDLFTGKVDDRLTIQKVLHSIIEKVVITSVHRHRNNNKHVVTIYVKDMLPPITILVVSKFRGVKAVDFVGEVAYSTMGHGKCYYVVADRETSELIEYGKNGQLKTEIQRVIDHLENFHPELYHPADVDGTEEIWEIVPPLIKMEELNIKGLVA